MEIVKFKNGEYGIRRMGNGGWEFMHSTNGFVRKPFCSELTEEEAEDWMLKIKECEESAIDMGTPVALACLIEAI